MGKNNVISLENRQAIADPLTQILQEGVKAFISQAVEAVLPELLTTHSERTMDDGRVAVVLNGYLPQCRARHGRKRDGSFKLQLWTERRAVRVLAWYLGGSCCRKHSKRAPLHTAQ